MKIILILMVCLFISCTNNKTNSDKKILDFGSFSIETPNNWTKIKSQGTDSYVGQIAIDSTDTLHFDLGWYSNPLTEPEPQIVERSWLERTTGPIDTSGLIIVNSRMGVDPDKYKKNNIFWDSINGRKVKIIRPIISGTGTTGIYIDSLWQAGSYIDRFNLYGDNLKPRNEVLVLQAIKTLKFSKKK